MFRSSSQDQKDNQLISPEQAKGGSYQERLPNIGRNLEQTPTLEGDSLIWPLGVKSNYKKNEENTRATQKQSVSKASVLASPLHPLLSDKLRNPLLFRRINKSALRSSSGPAVWRFRPQRSFARHVPVYISSKHPSCVHVRIISFWPLWLYLQNIWLALSRFWTHPWVHQTDPAIFTFCWFSFTC